MAKAFRGKWFSSGYVPFGDVVEYEVYWMPRAERQLQAAVRWWYANRSHKDLLESEIDAAVVSLRTLPSRALGVPPSRQPGQRRLLTPRTGYVLIYRVRPRLRRVDVLAMIHAKRR